MLAAWVEFTVIRRELIEKHVACLDTENDVSRIKCYRHRVRLWRSQSLKLHENDFLVLSVLTAVGENLAQLGLQSRLMAYHQPALHDVFVSTLRLGLGEASTVGLTLPPGALMSGCPGNCSGHGTCQDGQCICLVQFSGGTCHDVNIGYYIAFGSIFVLLGFVALVQLVVCMRYEYVKEDKRSWRRACQVTVQKLLYVLVVFATAIRGAYFFTKLQLCDDVASGLWSAYFPIIITGFSLIVCFWAEAFHISGSPTGERQFLSKSTMFFIAFNVLQYLLLAAQLIVSETALVLRVCNGGFALLMIIVVVFFLIYGVEVYFKVHGAFRGSESGLDTWQLHMSRIGLVAQAALQLITALFLVADVTSDIWRDKLPVLSLNFYDIGFRVVEFGVALWFPCVLWNCGQPEELWVLNPKRIFRSFQFHRGRQQKNASSVKLDCWICYDPERRDAGPLIQPCMCKGDVATVHHDCLKRWLVESAANDSSPQCRVCGETYKLEARYWIPSGLRPRHWLLTFLALLLLIGSPFAAYAICHSLSSASTYIQVLVIGTAVLLELISLRMFLTNGRASCQRTKVATMKIAGREVTSLTVSFRNRPHVEDSEVKDTSVSLTASIATGELSNACVGCHGDSGLLTLRPGSFDEDLVGAVKTVQVSINHTTSEDTGASSIAPY
ncbi:hypothetical protein BaRGS_00021375 [Batillaria attramentaria]|uniref:RING-CH-type domain-containing protein n=1 Tax=Batillaria attramentaria TaxID=370345 RepID=A0ABD0KK76_9CAEN